LNFLPLSQPECVPPLHIPLIPGMQAPEAHVSNPQRCVIAGFSYLGVLSLERSNSFI
jgi:hypothetical protein